MQTAAAKSTRARQIVGLFATRYDNITDAMISIEFDILDMS